jgi:hypothetical protein
MTSSEYEQLVEFLGRQLTTIGHQFMAIDRRFDALEQRLDERFREVFGHLEAIYRRLETLRAGGSRASWPMKSAAARRSSAASRS